MIQIINGNCLEVMKKIPENSIDSIITDPPYGLSFMGKEWDHGIPGKHFWDEALRVAKPGAHMLAFGGTRTFHRLTCYIEDAGWEIRDCLGWLYSQGFPKSHNISKAIDKMKGVEREVVGDIIYADGSKSRKTAQSFQAGNNGKIMGKSNITSPATPEAKQWDGWGSALKPAWEPIILARKPLNCTIAENVLKWGTGGINIDGCRVGSDKISVHGYKGQGIFGVGGKSSYTTKENGGETKPTYTEQQGRFPANIILSDDEEVVSLFPNESSRFFYCAKASSAERNKGCEDLKIGQTKGGGGLNNTPDDVCGKYGSIKAPAHNIHPTVKPIKLLRYLCKLITPPGGLIMDPFAGSGSTGLAAKKENFNCVMIDISSEYCEIAMRRNGLSEIYC